ncbi:MAG: hypothetical protein ACOCQW_02575 [Halanaerobiaceae bacterium]
MNNSINGKTILAEGTGNFKRKFWKITGIHLILIAIIVCIVALSRVIFDSAVQTTFLGGLPIGAIIYFALLILAMFLFIPVLTTGYQYLFVKLARKDSISFGDIFSGFSNFWSVWLTQYFYGILVLGGSFLFMIPVFVVLLFTSGINYLNNPYFMMGSTHGMENQLYSSNFMIIFWIVYLLFMASALFWSIKLVLAPVSTIDKNLKPGKALFYGNELSAGYKSKIFSAMILPIIISILLTFINIQFETSVTIGYIIIAINLFFLTPWMYSITGTAYEKISSDFNKKPPAKIYRVQNENPDPYTTETIIEDSPEKEAGLENEKKNPVNEESNEDTVNTTEKKDETEEKIDDRESDLDNKFKNNDDFGDNVDLP